MRLARSPRRWAASAILSVIALAVPARAETAQPPSITLLTMGPGDQAFSKFGHIAIWVRDPESQREEVFNYGTFRFDSPWLILDFLKGNLRYWLSVDTPAHTLAVYRRERRTVLAQELALGPEESRALLAFLRNNALPENRYYRYDYYYDNCSTRIRDVLDRASHGAIRAAGQAMVGRSVIADAPGRLTFRGHTARLVAENFPLYAALDIVMGPLIDQPITQWEETFLPAELARLARKAEVPTLSGPVPLVTREYEVVTSDRPLPRDTPPRWAWRFGAVGAAAAAIMATLAAIRSRATRALFAVLAAVSGLVCGLLGTAFTILWALTDHRVAYRNENLLLCSPLAFTLCAFAYGLARGRPAAARWSLRFLMVMAALAVLNLALQYFPATQDNGRWIAFFLPWWCGLSLGTWLILRRPTASTSASQPNSLGPPARRED